MPTEGRHVVLAKFPIEHSAGEINQGPQIRQPVKNELSYYTFVLSLARCTSARIGVGGVTDSTQHPIRLGGGRLQKVWIRMGTVQYSTVLSCRDAIRTVRLLKATEAFVIRRRVDSSTLTCS